MENGSLKPFKALLVLLVSSLAITGIGFIDDKIWNLVFAIVGIIAYAIVSGLFSLGLLRGKNAGKEAYAAVFIILLFIGFFIYQGIVAFQNWIISWPLAVKIIVPSALVLLIAGTIVILALKSHKGGN